MAKYPGYIMRQSLIDEAEKRLKFVKEESDKIYKTLNEKGVDETSKATLGEVYLMLLLGQVIAMRDVIEWAKEHSVPPAV